MNDEPVYDWIFREKNPREKQRDPVQEEFFKNDVVGDSCPVLIREAIQNSLDASREGCEDPVDVRIRISGQEGALDGNVAARWFGNLYSHVSSNDIGLPNPPQRGDSCPFLVVEDFNTTGLYGDVTQHKSQDGLENPFFYFFRAEGRSEKTGDKLGRWGLGKYVFPGASKGRTFFGLTRPYDSHDTLLMGQSVLKYHHSDGKCYAPDGNWGRECTGGPDGPCRDLSIIEEFKRDFGITRREESGLSVVIPWYDTEGVTFDKLVNAVVKDYYWPLIQSTLRVEISSSRKSERLDRDWLKREVEEGSIESLDREIIELAFWASDGPSDSLIGLAGVYPDNSNPWEDTVFPYGELESLCERYNSGERLAFKIPITIRPKSQAESEGSFRVYIRKVPGSTDSIPVFIRNGIIIREAATRRLRGCKALVVADDGPCAAMLGDAENPAHTKWEPSTGSFKDKYKYPDRHIKAVTESASSLNDRLSKVAEKENPTLLLDFFSLSEGSDQSRVRSGKSSSKGRHSPQPEVPVLPRLKRYVLTRREGGFTVLTGDVDTKIPFRMGIRVAYDAVGCSAPKAIKKYATPDFCLSSKRFHISSSGIEILGRRENLLELRVLVPDFHLDVDGFDTNRDIVVAVNAYDEESE